MSIQEFHAQFTSDTNQDELMGILRTLSQIEDLAVVKKEATDADDWGIWDTTTA